MGWSDRTALFVDWTEGDRARLGELRSWLESESECVLEELTEQLMRSVGMHSLAASAPFARHLQGVLRDWLTGLLDGASDDSSVEERRALGHKLARVGLKFEHVILLEGATRQRLFELAQKRLDGQPRRLLSTMRTLDKALNQDLALVYAGCRDLHSAEVEEALLDRFLTITGFSPNLYESLAQVWHWNHQQMRRVTPGAAS
jgi:hypothetical protein